MLIQRCFSCLQIKKSNSITLSVWHGGRKHIACLRTVRSLIENMIKGVTVVSSPVQLSLFREKISEQCLILFVASARALLQGFLYKMRAVYAHFPINCIINDGGKSVSIRNFLGEPCLLLGLNLKEAAV